MTIVLSWIKQSRSATYDRGKWSGSQNYLVRDTTDQAINVYDIASNASTYEVFGAGDDTTMATYMRLYLRHTRQSPTAWTKFGRPHSL